MKQRIPWYNAKWWRIGGIGLAGISPDDNLPKLVQCQRLPNDEEIFSFMILQQEIVVGKVKGEPYREGSLYRIIVKPAVVTGEIFESFMIELTPHVSGGG